jgi:hypothetical protein
MICATIYYSFNYRYESQVTKAPGLRFSALLTEEAQEVRFERVVG